MARAPRPCVAMACYVFLLLLAPGVQKDACGWLSGLNQLHTPLCFHLLDALLCLTAFTVYYVSTAFTVCSGTDLLNPQLPLPNPVPRPHRAPSTSPPALVRRDVQQLPVPLQAVPCQPTHLSQGPCAPAREVPPAPGAHPPRPPHLPLSPILNKAHHVPSNSTVVFLHGP